VGRDFNGELTVSSEVAPLHAPVDFAGRFSMTSDRAFKVARFLAIIGIISVFGFVVGLVGITIEILSPHFASLARAMEILILSFDIPYNNRTGERDASVITAVIGAAGGITAVASLLLLLATTLGTSYSILLGWRSERRRAALFRNAARLSTPISG
jgi:hypothetical protein